MMTVEHLGAVPSAATSSETLAAPDRRCGSNYYVDTSIYGGLAVRRDCAERLRFVDFRMWEGEPLSAEPDALDGPADNAADEVQEKPLRYFAVPDPTGGLVGCGRASSTAAEAVRSSWGFGAFTPHHECDGSRCAGAHTRAIPSRTHLVATWSGQTITCSGTTHKCERRSRSKHREREPHGVTVHTPGRSEGQGERWKWAATASVR